MLLLVSLLVYLDHAICNRYFNSCNYICSYYQNLKNNGRQNNELSPLALPVVAQFRKWCQFCFELVEAVLLMFRRITLEFTPLQDELIMVLNYVNRCTGLKSPINKPMCSFVVYVNKKCETGTKRIDNWSVLWPWSGSSQSLREKGKGKRKEKTTLIYFTFISVCFSEQCCPLKGFQLTPSASEE